MVRFAEPRDIVLHHDHFAGDGVTRAIVFLNSLGTDMRIWDDVRDRLDHRIPILAMDKRGHGLSQSGETTSPARVWTGYAVGPGRSENTATV